MQNEQNYATILVNLGLRDQEAKIYLACLKLGQSTVSDIAEEAGIQRTFVYDILEKMHERGFVSFIEIHGKKHYSAISLEQFRKIQLNKFKRFEAIIPELKTLEKTTGDRPKVRFYEGIEGIKMALYDPLETLAAGEVITAYANAEGFYQDEREFVAKYMKERVKKKIYSKTIAVDTVETRKYAAKDTEQLREMVLVPAKKFPFTNEIDIYGNKVAIMSVQKEYLAVIIESESVAKTQRSIFELAWLGAKTLKKE